MKSACFRVDELVLAFGSSSHDPGSGLAEILAFARVLTAIVIGEVGLNIIRWIAF